MRARALVAAAGLAVGTSGCDAYFFGPEPETGPESTFEALWRETDLHYAYFIEKDIDWNAVYAQYRPGVDPATTREELLVVLTEALNELQDIHTVLSDGRGRILWGGSNGSTTTRARNYDENVVTGYLADGRKRTPSGQISYGLLAPDIGYIHVRSLGGADWGHEIDEALAALARVRAVVFDLRGNPGGNSEVADEIAGRFADQRRLSQWIQFRNGPRHDDFDEKRPVYAEPRGAYRFTGPVALLTNRFIASSAERLVMHFQVLPHVTIIGDTTAGGAGNPIPRELPNGWSFQISRWKNIAADGFSPEGVGLPPDMAVWITPADSAAGKDTILERALAELGD